MYSINMEIPTNVYVRGKSMVLHLANYAAVFALGRFGVSMVQSGD